ncbi:hypothetical protein GOPIP_001_00780 [Gordonia polyisoprenivorans NBRC 16320 = JCM 10675]|uniref:Uncharacterized protein n=1 Tax=Gordonia polyisoprenivorans TaxID=84595 RepID=A0A846WJE0_9ACTN|nr:MULTISPECIES: hypothetical protein [Gordonia]MDF3284845.1 hypothetical protein [Gordonia sp. N1V]NKY01187.1 hypothetical protein [Gordonia polyisoprenivorans]OPX16116.1 hypothetical protein B1964_06435 [Gordonia sp. i37]QUD81134.1 hypothetical protein J8M97_14960 [Gordonia polyisoprenivorans]WCB39190.1 hypothetical protein PHA63_08810 [Gordonia polyisoprenivorans]
MSYPPGDPGGYPPGEGYPSGGGYPTPPPQGYGPGYPPPRSPWSSPLVIAAIVVGVLVVIGAGVGAYWLTRGSDSSDSAADSASTSVASASTQTVTSTVTGPGGASGPTGVPTTTTQPQVRPNPTVSGADWQGFLSGPRCNAADDPAIVIGRTSRSQVVICQVGNQTGRWYYKGLADGNPIEIGYPQMVGATYVARNGAVTYTVSPSALVISENGATLATEPMLEYWSSN